MDDFELILARFCDAFWVTIRKLLDFSIEVSKGKIRRCPVPLALVITTEVVLVFNSAWFLCYRLIFFFDELSCTDHAPTALSSPYASTCVSFFRESENS